MAEPGDDGRVAVPVWIQWRDRLRDDPAPLSQEERALLIDFFETLVEHTTHMYADCLMAIINGAPVLGDHRS